MLLRPPFIFAAVLVFSVLNGWMLMNSLHRNNGWSASLSLVAIGGTGYFVYIYHRLLTTAPDEA
jgi:hypothetical protein